MESTRIFIGDDRSGDITTIQEKDNTIHYKIKLNGERGSFQNISFDENEITFVEGNRYNPCVDSFSCKYEEIEYVRFVYDRVLHIFKKDKERPAIIWIDNQTKSEITEILNYHNCSFENPIKTHNNNPFLIVACILGAFFGIPILLSGLVVGDYELIGGAFITFFITVGVTFIYLGAFSIEGKKSRALEKMKVESEKEKIDTNSLYNKLVKAYSLAPDSLLSRIYNMNSSKILSATTYDGGGFTKQFDAAKYVCQSRERTMGVQFFERKDSDIVLEKKEDYFLKEMKEQYTLQEISEQLSLWISNYERPDIIQARLIKVLDNECQKKNDKEKSTIYLPIIKATSDFINEYEKIINRFAKRDKEKREESHEEYLNRKAEGLGFGIISSSVSQIALYSALDTYERNKELKRQETEIWSNMNSYNNASAITLAELIIELYENKFSKEIKCAIKEAYEIL